MFEITEWDVVAAVKKATGKDIDPDKAYKSIRLFDLKAASNAAAFQSDSEPGTGENDDDMNAATDRAIDNMAQQMKADPSKFSSIFV